MLSCWHVQPDMRPSFDDLEKTLFLLIGTDVAQRYIDSNGPYSEANEVNLNSGHVDFVALIGSTEHLAPTTPDLANDHDIEAKNALVDQIDCLITTADSVNADNEKVNNIAAQHRDQIEEIPMQAVSIF